MKPSTASSSRMSSASHSAFPHRSLARHPGVGRILVDACLHPSVARNPRDNLGRFSARHYRAEEARDIVSQLRKRRLVPSDIDVVVLTHLHEDHASAIEACPQ